MIYPEESLKDLVKENPMPPPTGHDLMTGPVKSGGLTRQEKEIKHMLKLIHHRLSFLAQQQQFDAHHLKLFLIALIFTSGGIVLLLFGFRLTVLFNTYEKDNIPAICFGFLLQIPMFTWLNYYFNPNKEERLKRKILKAAKQERQKPSLFNDLIEEAKKATAPPPRKIRIIFTLRKKDYPVLATNLKELCEGIENATGLPIERQLIRYRDDDINMDDLTKKLDIDLHMEDNDQVFVYNKGGYYTKDSEIRKKYEELTTMEQRLMREEAAKVSIVTKLLYEPEKAQQILSQDQRRMSRMFPLTSNNSNSSLRRENSGNNRSSFNSGGNNPRKSSMKQRSSYNDDGKKVTRSSVNANRKSIDQKKKSSVAWNV